MKDGSASADPAAPNQQVTANKAQGIRTPSTVEAKTES